MSAGVVGWLVCDPDACELCVPLGQLQSRHLLGHLDELLLGYGLPVALLDQHVPDLHDGGELRLVESAVGATFEARLHAPRSKP